MLDGQPAENPNRHARCRCHDYSFTATSLEVELRQIREAIQRLAYEVQRTKENAEHEREKLALCVEIEMLRAVKQLPPPEDARHAA